MKNENKKPASIADQVGDFYFALWLKVAEKFIEQLTPAIIEAAADLAKDSFLVDHVGSPMARMFEDPVLDIVRVPLRMAQPPEPADGPDRDGWVN